MDHLDIGFVRRQFPSFQHEETGKWIHLENAGGTYVPRFVIDRLNRFLIEAKVQPYGQYQPSKEATRAIETSTVKMAEMIHADPGEVVIGHCTTMNVYMLAKALRARFRPGDEVIVTNQEHEANNCAWRRLAEAGVSIREWKLNPHTGELELGEFEKLLSPKTALVCVNHSSNIVGSANDIKAIAQMAHGQGALLMVDGVSYAPHHCVDMKELDVDFYALSLYKVFGPHLGLLYVKEEHHDRLSNENFDFLPRQYRHAASPGGMNRLRIALNPGGVNHEECGCLAGITDYFDTLYRHHFPEEEKDGFRRLQRVFDLIEAHETNLAEIFQKYVELESRIELVGKKVADTRQRAPTFSFSLTGKMAKKKLVAELAKRNIAIQSGNFYAWRCVQALGFDPDDGVVRVSLVHYNTEEEMGHLCSCMEEILKESDS